jgi:hypothetical protein
LWHIFCNTYIKLKDGGIMKTIKNIICVTMGLFFFYILFGIFEYEAKAQTYQTTHMDISFNVFYRALSPYGVWFNYGIYGMCWKPSAVSRSWQPYRNGYWVWTNYGWTWMSNYNWGWATFHYGRWIIDPYHGWVWVPDYEWAPAWVQWRYSNDYIGWAPLPPGVRFDVHIGYDNRDYGVHYSYWNYINCRDFNTTNYQFITGIRVEQIHRQTKNITNITTSGRNIHNYGPSVTDIERVTRSRVTQYNIIDDTRATSRNNQRIENNNVYIYRPNIDRPVGSTRGNNQPNRSEQTQTINRTPDRDRTADMKHNEPSKTETHDGRSNTNSRTNEAQTNRTNDGQTNRTPTSTIKSNETPSSGRTVNQTPSTPNRSNQSQDNKNQDNKNRESNNRNSNNNQVQRNR